MVAALAGADAAEAFAAMSDLIAAPKDAVALIKDQVKPAAPLDRKRVEKLLAQLDDDGFDVREKASSELAKLGERLLPLLDKALTADPSPESRQRLQEPAQDDG